MKLLELFTELCVVGFWPLNEGPAVTAFSKDPKP